MTQCLNAGTGCGWCIPFLIKIAQDQDHQESDPVDIQSINPEQYAEQRKNYRTSQQKNTFDPDQPG